ncbi:hypothetical protein niasHT_025186 [Heterodera trifolii]|uniref:Ubiquitin-like domain-containing protein n=1 Tax=Heterodera trifolii TaxID=157864 RepID=A0ABD2JLB9_9BILA
MRHFGFSLPPIDISSGLIIMLMLFIPSSIDGMEITVKSGKNIPIKKMRASSTSQNKRPKLLTKTEMRVSSASQNERTTISVELKSGQTVAALKQAIEKETGIPLKQQQLMRHENSYSYVLQDFVTLNDYGPEKIEVFLTFGELEIHVDYIKRMFVSRVEKTDTVATLKEAINERFRIPTERQILRRSNRPKDDKLEDIETIGTDSLTTLRKKVRKANENFSIELQKLTLNSTFDLALKDTKTMEECGIKDGQNIILSLEFKINVRYGVKSYSVNVYDSDIVATLKEMIKKRFGIPTEKQILRRSNRRKYDNILEDLKTMDCYQQILDGNETVYLFITFTLNVETNEPWVIMKMKDKIKDNAFTVEVEGTDSVEKLKRKIGKTIGRYFSHGLQTLRQTDGLALEDDQTMDFYKIKEGQTILLTFHEFEIEIKYGKKKFSVNVKESDTVETLKKRIENIKEFGNIPHENQALIRWKNDIVLENDSEPLHKYRVGKDATVIVSWKEFEILVQFKEKQKTIEVNAGETVKIVKEKIKEMIVEKWGRYYGQLVKMELRKKDKDGKILDNDNETIEENGIKEEGDKVYVKCAFPPKLD